MGSTTPAPATIHCTVAPCVPDEPLAIELHFTRSDIPFGDLDRAARKLGSYKSTHGKIVTITTRRPYSDYEGRQTEGEQAKARIISNLPKRVTNPRVKAHT